MSTNQQNPIGVIDAKSGRLFSRTDHENLQRIERDAVIEEFVRFQKRVPEFAERVRAESVEAWTVSDGVTSKTNFIKSDVGNRLIATTESFLATGSYNGLDFYDRLTRSVMKRADRQAFLERGGLTWEPDLTDRDTDPRHPVVVFEWDDKRARRLARWLARRALPAAWKKTLSFLENSAKAHREFLDERRRLAREFAKENTKNFCPSSMELDDLTRRLFELIFSPTEPPIADLRLAAKKNQLLKKALAEYDEWSEKLQQLTRLHGSGPEAQEQASRQNAVTFARVWAFHWPAVLESWKLERRPALLAHVPASLLASKDGPLRLFGPIGSDNKAHQLSRGGQIERLVVSRGKTTIDLDQAHLQLSSRVQLGVAPTSDEIMRGVAQVLGNREVRFFIACFQAAHEDREAGETKSAGAFWYWPGRFADLLGMTTAKAARGCDDSLDALMNVSVQATLKSGGKPLTLTAKSLVIDAGATLEPIGAPDQKTGRRPRRLMSIQDSILGLLEGGYWFPLTRAMLATPEGVDPRTYDDAFRLLMVLSSLARTNARKAKRPSDLSWSNNIETVLEAAGAAPSARHHERVQRLQALLEILTTEGHLRYEITDEKLHFDLPKLRPALTQVPEKTRNKVLPRGG